MTSAAANSNANAGGSTLKLSDLDTDIQNAVVLDGTEDTSGPPGDGGSRVAIQVNDRFMRDITADSIAVLAAARTPDGVRR